LLRKQQQSQEPLSFHFHGQFEGPRQDLSGKGRAHWVLHDDETGHCNGIVWLTACGESLLARFGDLILADATYKTNSLGLPLLLFVVVDYNFCSRICAGAFIRNETTKIHTQVLSVLQSKFLTDFVLISDWPIEFCIAVQQILPAVRHLRCWFHLSRNIESHVLGTLRKETAPLMLLMNKCRSARDEVDFTRNWQLVWNIVRPYERLKTYFNDFHDRGTTGHTSRTLTC